MSTQQKVQLLMPEMGESVTEGTVLEWHVSEGDSVEEGQTMVEVSTDKVDAEVPAPASGTVTKILVQVDEDVDVGKPLAEIDPDGGAPAAEGTEEQEEAPAEREASAESNGASVGGAVPAADAAQEEKATADDASVAAGRSLEGGGLEIVMPEMGESVTEGTVLEWHVSEGDSVEEGQTMVE
ncbi:MAG: biotin/lipoyl-containing protein, partial [Solirubrobacterales bacterium]